VPPRASEIGRGPSTRLLEAPLAALAFLTIVPLPRRLQPAGATAQNDAAAWFPLIGAGIGALAGAVRLLGYDALGAGPSTALAFLVAVGVTAALHQDALADCADAIGVGGDRDRRLEVMRDGTIGVYGILTLGLWGLLMYAALEQTTRVDGLLVLLTAGAAGRLAGVVHAAVTSPAPDAGEDDGFAPGPLATAVALVMTCAIALLAVGVVDGIVAVGTALITVAVGVVLARRELGGRTADTLGAASAVAEVIVVVVLSALLMH
jgi:adenosylcobinamide-GDP ribazoletransferase